MRENWGEKKRGLGSFLFSILRSKSTPNDGRTGENCMNGEANLYRGLGGGLVGPWAPFFPVLGLKSIIYYKIYFFQFLAAPL